MDKINEIVENMLTNDELTVNSLILGSSGNQITDKVREEIGKLPEEQRNRINKRLENILTACYSSNEIELKNLSSKELFLLKESLIYYIGRITKTPNIKLLKNIYKKETDNHLKLNITFSSVMTGDEEIEQDFIEKIKPGNDLDLLIRSWTLAFFANMENPYNYIDEGKDWSLAKLARLKRLIINDESSEKFEKAKAFRWLDLTVINLFLNNRGYDSMDEKDYEIVENAKVDFPSYSEEKVKKLKLLKKDIAEHNPYKN